MGQDGRYAVEFMENFPDFRLFGDPTDVLHRAGNEFLAGPCSSTLSFWHNPISTGMCPAASDSIAEYKAQLLEHRPNVTTSTGQIWGHGARGKI